ncbi:uncharacterized protein C8R40DRAFT_1173106 [Lentinula edodes]|uniref:uncharacterized protein n=1 Tax=Lentinula edodes TaxID=5353 RepID=UPI001E8CB548|nr:uncharacterized protein C8R40DRAFT_1173106 [Lentinula edodes]KAH7873039.1 hypothetical protein C8R40DRAFT_1173106 [Lentinula edodes]
MSTRTANVTASSSSPLPSHFNPFATHPFTSCSSVSSASRPTSQPQPQLSPSTQPRSTPHPPPTRTTASPKAVFVPFRQGAASPDLYEILKKKPQPTQITSPKKS